MIVRPLEDILGTISGLDRLTATAYANEADIDSSSSTVSTWTWPR